MLATLGIIQSSRPSGTLLLDLYSSAAAAYSLRKLRTSYSGSAIRVRRSSDNTELDIGFDVNGNLNESSITTFVGANSGYVTKWYDQSGNGRDAAQTTSANQPRIVNSGTVDKVNNKPACYFDGSNDGFTYTSISSNSNFTSFTIAKRFGANTKLIALANDSGYQLYTLIHYSNERIYVNDRSRSGYVADTSTTQNLYMSLSTTDVAAYKNGVLLSLSNTNDANTNNFNTLGYRSNGITPEYSNGYIQEIIHYSVDKSLNRTGIESNINSYYSIY